MRTEEGRIRVILNRVREKKRYILKGIIIRILLLSLFIVMFYSLSAKDDFGYAIVFRNCSEEGGHLFGILRYIKDLYFSWDGCYFSVFVETYLAPLARVGIGGLR